MITAAERIRKSEHSEERGQSVVEFLLILPLMVGLTILLIRVNTAIQVAIVNQQYARAQIFSLAYNGSTYPYIGNRVGNLDAARYNQLILGVADEIVPTNPTGFVPTATAPIITKASGAQDVPGQLTNTRKSARLWNTVAICTQVNVVDVGGKFVPLIELDGPNFSATGPSRMGERTVFEYCHSPKGTYE